MLRRIALAALIIAPTGLAAAGCGKDEPKAVIPDYIPPPGPAPQLNAASSGESGAGGPGKKAAKVTPPAGVDK